MLGLQLGLIPASELELFKSFKTNLQMTETQSKSTSPASSHWDWRPKLRWFAAEIVIVVAGVLIALTLNAWWEGRQFDHGVAEDLVILDSEIRENVRLAQLTVDMMNEVVAANESLIDRLSQSESPTVDIGDNVLLWVLFINPTLDLSLGGIDAWIASGRMAGIENPVLRQRLAGIRGMADDAVEEQRVAREVGIQNIYNTVEDAIGDIDAVREFIASGYHLRSRDSISVIPETSSITVPNSNSLRFLLQARVIWYEASIQEVTDFRSDLLEIQALVREEHE